MQKNIFLGSIKVICRKNGVHNLEDVEPHQKKHYVVAACYDERSDFPDEVQNTLACQHRLCMKKGHAFNAPTGSSL